MSAVIAEPAEQQTDPVLRQGQQYIARRWSALAPSTRELLMKSGYYGPRGNRLEPSDPPPFWIPETNAEQLEMALGTLVQCVGAKVPSRREGGALVPPEALTDEVLEGCYSLLAVPRWHDPEFLRNAIIAAAVHQMANALTMAPVEKDESVNGLLAAVGKLVPMLAAAFGLAVGSIAAFRQDLWPAFGGFTLMAWSFSAARSAAPKSTGKPKRAPRAEDDMPKHFEYAYNAWYRFRYLDQYGVVGASAKFHLERMANEGINVPPVAFDLAEALRLRVHSLASEHRPS